MPCDTLNIALLDFIPNRIQRVLTSSRQLLYGQTPYILSTITTSTYDVNIIPFLLKNAADTVAFTQKIILDHAALDADLRILKQLGEKIDRLETFKMEMTSNRKQRYVDDEIQHARFFFDKYRYSTLRDVELASFTFTSRAANYRFLIALFGGKDKDNNNNAGDNDDEAEEQKRYKNQKQYPLMFESLKLTGNYFLDPYDLENFVPDNNDGYEYFNLFHQIVEQCPRLKTLSLKRFPIYGNEFESLIVDDDEKNEHSNSNSNMMTPTSRKRPLPKIDRLEIVDPFSSDSEFAAAVDVSRTDSFAMMKHQISRVISKEAAARQQDDNNNDKQSTSLNNKKWKEFCTPNFRRFERESLAKVLSSNTPVFDQLRTLVLKNCYTSKSTSDEKVFSKETYEAISNLTKLEVLDLGGPKRNFDDECLLKIAKSCVCLVELDIGYEKKKNKLLTHSNYGTNTSFFSTGDLEDEVNRNDSITPKGLIAASPFLSDVRCLKLFNLSAVCSESISAIAENIGESLQYLDIAEAYNIYKGQESFLNNEEGLLQSMYDLMKHCGKSLRVLHIERLSSTMPNQLSQLFLQQCPNLQKLSCRFYSFYQYFNSRKEQEKFKNPFTNQEEDIRTQSQLKEQYPFCELVAENVLMSLGPSVY